MSDLIPTCIDEANFLKDDANLAKPPYCRKKENQVGELYTITLGKDTHTLRVGSRCEIDELIKSTMKQDMEKEGKK